MRSERRTLYVEFADTFVRLNSALSSASPSNDFGPQALAFEAVVSKLILYAPDEVAEMATFLQHGINALEIELSEDEPETEILRGRIRDVYIKCLLAMRKDTFRETKLEPDQLQKIEGGRRLPIVE